MKYINFLLNNEKVIERLFGDHIKILIQSKKISIFCNEKDSIFLARDLHLKGLDYLKRKNVNNFVIEIPFKQSNFNLKKQEFSFYFEENLNIIESKDSDLKYALNNYNKKVICDCYANKQWINGIEKIIDGNLISNIEKGFIKNLRSL